MKRYEILGGKRIVYILDNIHPVPNEPRCYSCPVFCKELHMCDKSFREFLGASCRTRFSAWLLDDVTPPDGMVRALPDDIAFAEEIIYILTRSRECVRCPLWNLDECDHHRSDVLCKDHLVKYFKSMMEDEK